jgi:hypothetical protein
MFFEVHIYWFESRCRHIFAFKFWTCTVLTNTKLNVQLHIYYFRHLSDGICAALARLQNSSDTDISYFSVVFLYWHSDFRVHV